jgi:hypothetical protein
MRVLAIALLRDRDKAVIAAKPLNSWSLMGAAEMDTLPPPIAFAALGPRADMSTSAGGGLLD